MVNGRQSSGDPVRDSWLLSYILVDLSTLFAIGNEKNFINLMVQQLQKDGKVPEGMAVDFQEYKLISGAGHRARFKVYYRLSPATVESK